MSIHQSCVSYCKISMWGEYTDPTGIINQSIKFLQCQYPQLSQDEWHDSQIDVQQQTRRSSSVTTGVLVSMGERPSQRDVSSDVFLKEVETEAAEWTDSGRLLQLKGHTSEILLHLH